MELEGGSLTEIAQTIMSAFLTGEEGDKDSTLQAFILKVYKINTAVRPRRMNSIRLSRFCAFLYKVVQLSDPEPSLVEVTFQTLITVLMNDRNFQEYEDDEAVHSICHWSAQLSLTLLQINRPELVEIFFNFLLHDIKPTPLPLDQFEELLKQTEYAKNNELTQKDEKRSMVDVTDYHICTELNAKKLILEHVNIPMLYGALLKTNRTEKTLKNLLKHITLCGLEDGMEIFRDCLKEAPVKTTEDIEAILLVLENTSFDCESTERVITNVLARQENLAVLCNVCIEGLSTEDIYLQSVANTSQHFETHQIVDTFLKMTEPKNFFLFYLISKRNVPEKYLELVLEEEIFNFKKGLIFALAIIQEPLAYKKLIKKVTPIIERVSGPQRILVLRGIYLSLQKINQTTLFCSILKRVRVEDLNKKCDLEFGELHTATQEQMSEESKRELLNLLKILPNNDEELLRLKIELQAICGQEMALLAVVKYLSVHFQKPIEELLSTLPTQKEEYLEGVLMGINNRLEVHLLVEFNELMWEWAIQEACRTRKDFYNKLRKHLDSLNFKALTPFCVALAQLNEKNAFARENQRGPFHGDFTLVPHLDCLLTGINKRRLTDDNFIDFYIREGKESPEIARILKNKAIFMELKLLIKNLILNEDKAAIRKNRKEIKGLLEDTECVYVAKAIFYCLEAMKQTVNEEPLLKLLESIFERVRPESAYLESIESLSKVVEEDHYDLIGMIPELLKRVYVQTINFLGKIVDTFEADKKNMKKKQKTIWLVLVESLPALLGDTSALPYLQPLFKILLKLKDFKELSPALNLWLGTMRIFHVEDFASWRTRVISFCDMWHKILLELQAVINLHELQRHALLLTDLLNTLCEKYRGEAEAAAVEEKILRTQLLLIQSSLPEETDQKRCIPNEEITQLLLPFRASSSTEEYFYYCYTCENTICSNCSAFVHRHHDKISLLKEGLCAYDSTSSIRKNEASRPIGSDFRKDYRQELKDERREDRRDSRMIGRREDRGEERMFNRREDIREDREPYLQIRRFEEGRVLNHLHNFMQVPTQIPMHSHLEIDQYEEFKHINREIESHTFNEQALNSMFRFGYYNEQMREDSPPYLGNYYNPQDEFNGSQLRARYMSRPQQQQVLAPAVANDLLEMPCNKDTQVNVDFPFYEIGSLYHPQCTFAPNFAPVLDRKRIVKAPIDLGPLVNLLKRELIAEAADKLEERKSNVHPAKVLVHFVQMKDKYSLFSVEVLSDGGRKDAGWYTRGPTRRNMMTANKRTLVVLAAGSGLIPYSLPIIVQSFMKREQTKAYGNTEEDKAFLCAYPYSLNFRPVSIVFSLISNSNLLAVVGSANIEFLTVTPDWKIQKIADLDFSNENITQFKWLSRYKNIFAFSSGKKLFAGLLAESGLTMRNSKLVGEFEQEIRDFESRWEGGRHVIYTIDVSGNFNRNECYSRRIKAKTEYIYTASKAVQAEDMFFYDDKVALCLNNSTIMLYQIRPAQPLVLLQTLVLNNVANSPPTNFAFIACTVVHESEDFALVAALLTPCSPDKRKHMGNFCLLKICSTSLEVLFQSEDQPTYSYEVYPMQQNNILFMGLDEEGEMWVFRYCVQVQSKTSDLVRVAINETVIQSTNRAIKAYSLFSKMTYYDEYRCLGFREQKEVTGGLNIEIKDSNVMILSPNNLKSYVTGIILMLDGAPEEESNPDLQGSTNQVNDSTVCVRWYNYVQEYKVNKAREVHLPLNLKESLMLFVEQVLVIKVEGRVVKKVRVYGTEASQDFSFNQPYQKLLSLVSLHMDYDKEDLEAYLANSDRVSLKGVRLEGLAKLQETKKYTQKQLNLLLRLETLTYSLVASRTPLPQSQATELLFTLKQYILGVCEGKIFLENACKRLVRAIGQPHERKIGSLFEYSSFFDFYYFERKLQRFNQKKSLQNYYELTVWLQELIYKRTVNLYLILHAQPQLVWELSTYFRVLLNELRQKVPANDQNQNNFVRQKLLASCIALISLVMEYYQVAKGSPGNIRAEETAIQQLEAIFCPYKAKSFFSMFIHPFLSFERQASLPQEPLHIESAYDPFTLNTQEPMEVEPAHNIVEAEDDLEDDDIKDMLIVEEQQGDKKVEEDVGTLGPFSELSTIDAILRARPLLPNETLPFVYHCFHFEIAAALFRRPLNNSNVNFLGTLLFNLLRIIEVRMDLSRDASSLRLLFEAIDAAIDVPNQSEMFLVLNVFMEATAKGDIGRLRNEIARFYSERGDWMQRFLSFNAKNVSSPVRISSMLISETVSSGNQVYVLQFIGNMIVALAPTDPTPLKSFVLSCVVKYDIPVFRNLMVAQLWSEELDAAKVEVGFEKIREDLAAGVCLLYETALNTPLVLLAYLRQYPAQIFHLEQYLNTKEEPRILEILSIYYSHP